MNWKKITAFVLSATMVFSMVACGGGTPQTDSESETTTPVVEKQQGEAVTATGETISVSIWDTNQEPGIKQILDDFTAKTGIKCEIQVVNWAEYWTMLEAGAQGGSLPDVFWMHSNESQRYMSNDMLLDITDKIAASDVIDPANYPEDIWGLYTYNDKNYAIPKDVDTVAVWYNKAMFDEAGVAYPTADWTWDDMFEMAKKLTKEDGSQFGLAIKSDNNQAGYYNMIYDNGGSIISEDKMTSGMNDPKTVEALQQLEAWVQSGIMPSIETMSENGEDVLFQSGKVAMVLQGSWMVAAYRDNEYTAENADVVELPKNATTGKRISIYNGLGWAAAANGKNTEGAWQLLEYLGSKEAQIKQAELGVTMSAFNETSDAWAKSANFNLQAYLNMMEDMVIRPYSKTTVTWENNNNEMIKNVYSGQMTMAEACEAMATFMNESLAAE